MNKRDVYGLIGWFFVAVVFGIVAEAAMVLREVWQWTYYGLASFEIDDVKRYSVVICLGSLINAMLILFALTLAGVI